MQVQYLLVLVDRPVQISLDDAEVLELLLLPGIQLLHVDILLFQLGRPEPDHLAVACKLLLRVADRLHIFMHECLVVRNRVAQRVAPHAQHRLLDLLQLYAHEIKDILDLVDRLVITLLFEMELEDHLMDRELHVILDLECGEH